MHSRVRRCTSMGFSLIVLDFAFTYIKFKLLVAFQRRTTKFRDMQLVRGR